MEALRTNLKNKITTDSSFLPYALLVLGICIRAFHYFSVDFWYDESIVLYETQVFGLHQYEPSFFHPPLHNLIVILWMTVSQSIVWIKILPLIWGSMALVVTYRVGQRLFNRNAGLWGMALLALMPFHTYYSRDLKMYGMQAFLIILAWYCFLRIYSAFSYKGLLIFTLSATFALYSHYFAMFPLAAMGICSLLLLKKNKYMAHAAGGLILSVILFSPSLIKLHYAATHLMAKGDFFAPDTTLRYMARLWLLLIAGYHGNRFIAIITAILVSVLVLIGLVKAPRSKRLILWSMVVFPFLLHYLVGVILNYDYIVSRYLTYMTCMIAIAAGFGISTLRKKTALLLMAVIVALNISNLAGLYRDKFNGFELYQGVRPKEEYSEPTDYIAKNWKSGDVIGHACLNSWAPFYFYLFMENNIHQGFVLDFEKKYAAWLDKTWNVGRLWNYHQMFYPVDYEEVIKNHSRLWFVASEWDINQPGTFDTDFTWILKNHLISIYPIIDYKYYYGCPVYLLDLTQQTKK